MTPSLKSSRQRRYETQRRGEKEVKKMIGQMNTVGMMLLAVITGLIVLGYYYPFLP